MAKHKKIDPTSTEIVLAYVGDPERHHGIVPSRDLHGHDLARIAFRRRYQASEDDLATRGTIIAPDAGHEDVDAIADELVATGNWSRDVPRETTEPVVPAEPTTPVVADLTEPSTDEPAAPADTAEAVS